MEPERSISYPVLNSFNGLFNSSFSYSHLFIYDQSSHLRLDHLINLFPLGLFIICIPFWLHSLPTSIFYIYSFQVQEMKTENYEVHNNETFPQLILILHGFKIQLMILFANNFTLCSSLDLRNGVQQPYRMTGNIIVICPGAMATRFLAWCAFSSYYGMRRWFVPRWDRNFWPVYGIGANKAT